MKRLITSQLFSGTERELLETAAQHAADAEEFVHRVCQIIRELRTDKVEPAVAKGRYEILVDWMRHDPSFADMLYRNLLGASGLS